MQRVILATGHGAEGLFHDEAGLPAAFAAHGIELDVRRWQDIDPDGTPILIRTTWDYTQHYDEFLAWLHRLDETGTPCINPTNTLRWSMDKEYLIDLRDMGHAIVPTVVLEQFSPELMVVVAQQQGWVNAIAKPTIGGGAEGLVQLDNGHIKTFSAKGNTWAPNAPDVPIGACLIQPFMPEISEGEWSLFFFGGSYSHAILKTPATGDIRVQEEHGGTTVGAEPPAEAIVAAQTLLLSVDAPVARVDGVMAGGQFLLMELELVEPELYFRCTNGGELRYVEAVVDWLAQVQGSAA